MHPFPRGRVWHDKTLSLNESSVPKEGQGPTALQSPQSKVAENVPAGQASDDRTLWTVNPDHAARGVRGHSSSPPGVVLSCSLELTWCSLQLCKASFCTQTVLKWSLKRKLPPSEGLSSPRREEAGIAPGTLRQKSCLQRFPTYPSFAVVSTCCQCL